MSFPGQLRQKVDDSPKPVESLYHMFELADIAYDNFPLPAISKDLSILAFPRTPNHRVPCAQLGTILKGQ